MKLSVLRANRLIADYDLASEIAGIEGDHSFFIGRSEDCHIVLDDKQVSREHGEILFKNGGWFIRRLSQSSPIILNGQPAIEEELRNGDMISIGPFVLNVSITPLRPMGVFVDEETQAVSLAQTESLMQPSAAPKTATVKPVKIEEASETMTTASEESTGEIVSEGAVSSENYEEQPNQFDQHDETMGNTAAPAGEVSSAEVAMNFNDEPIGDQVEGFDVGENMLPTTDSDEGSTRVFKSFAKFELEIYGEYAPYDKYVLEMAETFIGRDPAKCQIVLKDPEVSSVHAVIRKNNITCVLEDLRSANGTLLNAQRINKADLTTGDEFIIGSTTFTFKVQSDLLHQEEQRLMPVEEDQEIEVVEEVEETVTFGENTGIITPGTEGGDVFGAEAQPKEKSIIKRIMKEPAMRKKALYVVVGLLLLWVFMDDSSQKPAPKPKTAAGEQKNSNLLPGIEGAKNATETASTAIDPNKPAAPKCVPKKLSKEETETAEASYLLANDHFSKGKYREAMMEMDRILRMTCDYKNAKQLYDLSKEGLARLERLEEERRKSEEKKARAEKIRILVEKAKEAVKEHQSELADSLFAEILKIDPENYEVPQYKLEIEAWKREQERIANEKAMKEAERSKKVSQLSPGKTFYLKKEWYKAIVKLEEFARITPMDEDLTKEAAEMLTDSKNQLQNIVGPLIGKARSLKEGQDLKGSYETYLQILAYDPVNTEALNEMAEIRDTLYSRARKIYREGIISESLSLFEDAKEKFQEVQQISPSDSEYYKKATDKLRDYTD